MIENYYAKDVVEAYGVTPVQFIDMKGLMGDTSDNIPGVPGIGEKTAAKLMIEYGSMENILDHLDTVKPPRVQKNLTGFNGHDDNGVAACYDRLGFRFRSVGNDCLRGYVRYIRHRGRIRNIVRKCKNRNKNQ